MTEVHVIWFYDGEDRSRRVSIRKHYAEGFAYHIEDFYMGEPVNVQDSNMFASFAAAVCDAAMASAWFRRADVNHYNFQ